MSGARIEALLRTWIQLLYKFLEKGEHFYETFVASMDLGMRRGQISQCCEPEVMDGDGGGILLRTIGISLKPEILSQRDLTIR